MSETLSKAQPQSWTGEFAYEVYGESVGFKNFRGDPMPLWKDLGDQIQQAWSEVATACFFRGAEAAIDKLKSGTALLEADLSVLRQN